MSSSAKCCSRKGSGCDRLRICFLCPQEAPSLKDKQKRNKQDLLASRSWYNRAVSAPVDCLGWGRSPLGMWEAGVYSASLESAGTKVLRQE